MQTMYERLGLLADEEYKAFQCRLMPTVDPQTVIGVRTPSLRAFAKELTPLEKERLLQTLPHTYYEENNLHAFVIEQIGDFEECIHELDRFLPYVDNWATCDMMRPRIVKKHKAALFNKCREWIASPHPFAVRYGLGMLMLHGLEEDFDPAFLQLAAAVRRDEYYINMMIAWFFATALTKRYDETVAFLQSRVLPPWVHNKAIQKACESRVIPKDIKTYLKTLKW